MRAGILGLVDGTVDDPTIPSRHVPPYAIDSEGVTYLGDEATIYHGTAAGATETREQTVHVTTNDDGDVQGVFMESEQSSKRVAVDFTADLDATPGFVSISSSDGEFLWERLAVENQVDIKRARIDLDAFAQAFEQREHASTWQVGRNNPHAGDNGRVEIEYHDAASTETARQGFVVQLGFMYRWGDHPIRGSITESGYVAAYSGADTPATWGKWLREEVLPHASIPDDDIQGKVCQRCNRVSDTLDDNGLCITCRDLAEEQGGEA